MTNKMFWKKSFFYFSGYLIIHYTFSRSRERENRVFPKKFDFRTKIKNYRKTQ